jgi:hypothetical protein
VYIEKEIAERFTSDEIIKLYDFFWGSCRVKFKLIETYFFVELVYKKVLFLI